MRVKIQGKSDIARIVQCLEALQRRAPGLEFHNVNVYVTLKDADGNTVEIVNEEGDLLDTLLFKDETKKQRAARPLAPVASLDKHRSDKAA